MNEIVELATRLGRRIASDPRGQQFAAARAALEGSPADRQLLGDYEAQQRKIMDLEAGGKPIEVEDKRRLSDLYQRVVGSEVIRNLLKAQTDFLEVLQLVTQIIERESIGPDESPA
ncbi:MAG: YlbF family regulator [Planctomycetes bacterium]|nr:YlbF family regulator [Planctomycetota bacterium]